MMHAIKGGWVGQTFALSTCNDSGGKKARIRRSKEERKAMVESFIKKYQNSNTGNFPSLNLTHKEVGGSFYTVREIVREIIQENRVLGPAKFPSEEQSDENLLEHNPLGSISIEPQRSLLPTDETNIISYSSSKQNQGSGEELVVNSSGQSFGSDHQRLDIEQIVNDVVGTVKDDVGSLEPSITEAATYPHKDTSDEHLLNLSRQFQVPDCEKFDDELLIGNGGEATDENEESDEPILGSPVSISHHKITREHRQENIEKQILHSSRDFPEHSHLKLVSGEVVNVISQTTEDEDEYELPASRMAVVEYSPNVEKGQSKQLDASDVGRSWAQAEITVEKFPLHPVAKKFTGLEGRSEQQSQETGILMVNGIEKDREQVLENSSSFMNVEVGADVSDLFPKEKSEPVDKTACHNVAEIGDKISSHVEVKSANAPISVNENPNNRSASVKHNSYSKQVSNSTSDRIKLETREKTSKKLAGSETNPLLAFFKAFATAFVKFWTE